MAVSPQADCEYEQEIRFAVVLYGGVSLAIYMNGIAQELLRMVRGTANFTKRENFTKPEKLTGTELIYRELGQLLGLEGASKAEIKPDSPIRTRFVVDIISGTSAGGINGVALAKALALKCRDLSVLKKTWLEEAQLDRLLNDKKSEERRYRVGSKRTSLLNSERMYGKILETLVEMNDPKKCTADAADFADNLDLFVTATDLVGLAARIQLTGQTIQEKVHKAVFHFEYPSPKQKNEFDAEHDPMLAFAARCTSSFPAAFEPMRFDHIGTQLKSQLGGSLEDAITDFEDFFPAYRAAGVEFRNRQFADGGYLDNRPFSYVTDLITYRSAKRPTKRKLLFVDPFPELLSQNSDTQHEIHFLENALLAAVSLPRYEVIRGDIQTINTYNRRLERLAALKVRDQEDKTELGKKKRPRKSMTEFAGLDLKQMVKDYGEFYPRYHHLRVYDATDVLARMVTRLAGFEADSDEYSYLRRILRAWRDEHYNAYADPDDATKESENAFLVHFDIDYRLRRLNHVRSCIDEMLSIDEKRSPEDPEKLTDAAKADLAKIRSSTEDQLEHLRDKVRKLESRTRSPLLEEVGSRYSIDELKRSLPAHFGTVMHETTLEGRRKAAEKVYRHSALKSHIDTVMERIRFHLENVFDQNRADMEAVLPSDARLRRSDPIADIHEAFHCFHWHDVSSLPFLEGSGAREHAEVEIYRVSPADSALKPSYLEEGKEKLVGTAVGAFGGFLLKEWREHDMMWGRLDGAERIITALLPEPSDDDSGTEDHGRKKNKLREKLIRRAQDIILQEEFSLGESGNRDRIFYWLAHKLRDRDVTDASAADLIKRGDKLLTTFPGLSDVVSRGDFRTFLLTHYCPPPPPDPDLIADWSARSFKILGQMIDDLPDDRLEGLRSRLAGASRSAGVLLTNMLTFATPGSIGRKVSGHWLILIALAALLLIAVGPLVGLSEAGLIGAIVIAACLSLWAFSQSFGKWVKGRRGFHPFLTLAALIVIGFVMLGAIDFWNTVKELTGADVSRAREWLSDAWASKRLFRYAAMAVALILAPMGLVKLWELKPWRWVTSSLAWLWHAIRPPRRRDGPAKRTAADAG